MKKYRLKVNTSTMLAGSTVSQKDHKGAVFYVYDKTKELTDSAPLLEEIRYEYRIGTAINIVLLPKDVEDNPDFWEEIVDEDLPTKD